MSEKGLTTLILLRFMEVKIKQSSVWVNYRSEKLPCSLLKMTWVTCVLTSQTCLISSRRTCKTVYFMDRIYFCHQQHIVWLPLLVHVKVTDDHMDKIVKSIGLLQQCSLNMTAENQELMYLGYFSKINILGFFAQQLSSTELTAGITERNSVSCWHYQP